MAVNVASLEATLEANTRDFDRDMNRATRNVKDFGDTSQKTSSKMATIGRAAVAVGAALGAARIGQFAFEATQLAVAAEEAGSAFATTFGPSTGKASKFVDEFANKAGFANFELEQMLAITGNVVQGLGGTEEQSRVLAQEMAVLAGDVASFSNAAGGAEAVLGALKSALTGEREALKTYGIVLTEAEVQQRALANSGKTAAKELTALEKATATVQIASERAGKAVGDLDRTVDSAANKQRRLAAEVKEAKTALGQALLPALEATLPVLIRFAEATAVLFGDDFANDVRTMSAAVEEFGGDLDAAAGSVVDAARDNVKLQKILEDTGLTFEQLTGFILDDKKAMAEVQAALVATGAKGNALKTVLFRLRDAARAAAVEFQTLRSEQNRTRFSTGEMTFQVAEATVAVETFGTAIGGPDGLIANTLEATVTTDELARRFTEAGGSMETAASRMRDNIVAATKDVIQIFGDMPEQFDLSVEEMLRRADQTKELGDRLARNMAAAASMGLTALADQMAKDGPEAVEAYERLLADIGSTFDLADTLGDKVAAALAALENADQARWVGLGIFWGNLIEQGFNPTLPVPSLPGGGGGGGPAPTGPGGGFQPQALLAGINTVGGQPVMAGGNTFQVFMDTVIGDNAEDQILTALGNLDRDGRLTQITGDGNG